MKKSTVPITVFALALFNAGCGGSPGDPHGDLNRSPEDVRAHAKASDKDTLKKIEASYEAALDALQKELVELSQEFDPAEIMKDGGKALQKRTEPIQEEMSKMLTNLGIYTQERLKRK